MQEFENEMESLERNLEVWQQRLEDPALKVNQVRQREDFMNDCCAACLANYYYQFTFPKVNSSLKYFYATIEMCVFLKRVQLHFLESYM